MKKTKEAFKWIVKILKENKIPYIISGGFAAQIYGSKRPLFDIDMGIPDAKIHVILPFVKKYAIYGPKVYKDKDWENLLMILEYKGQRIDIAGTDAQKMFDPKKKKWINLKTDFSDYTKKKIYGEYVRLEKKEELIRYKKRLGRKVDKEDLAYLQRVK